MLKGLTVRSLLSLLAIKVYKGETGASLADFSARNKPIFWPSLILLSLGTWLAAASLGTGLLVFISTNFPAEEEGRFTLLLITGIGIIGIMLGFFLFTFFRSMIWRQLGVAVALGCEYLIVVGIAGEGYSLLWGTLAALLLLVLLVRFFTDAIHQIGSAVIFCGMLTFTAAHYADVYLEPVMIIITLPLAVAALFYPLRNVDLRPLAMVFIICPLVLAFIEACNPSEMSLPDILSRGLYIGFYAFLLGLLNPSFSSFGRRFAWFSFIPVLVFGLLSSSGIAASFFVIFMAYMLGSRLVMSAGIITNIIFTVMFYSSLHLTPEEKSVLMFLTAAVVFGFIQWLKRQNSASGLHFFRTAAKGKRHAS